MLVSCVRVSLALSKAAAAQVLHVSLDWFLDFVSLTVTVTVTVAIAVAEAVAAAASAVGNIVAKVFLAVAL